MSDNAQGPLTESERALLFWAAGVGILGWLLCIAGAITAMLMLP